MCMTHTSDKTSKSAAPSLRSLAVVTGLARLNVAKKSKKASISFRWEAADCSDMSIESQRYVFCPVYADGGMRSVARTPVYDLAVSGFLRVASLALLLMSDSLQILVNEWLRLDKVLRISQELTILADGLTERNYSE